MTEPLSAANVRTWPAAQGRPVAAPRESGGDAARVQWVGAKVVLVLAAAANIQAFDPGQGPGGRWMVCYRSDPAGVPK